MILTERHKYGWRSAIYRGKLFCASRRFKVCTSVRYLGIYIRDKESKRDWLKDRMDKWEKNICAVTKTAWKYLQESYAAVVRDIQSERIFLQRVMKDMGQAFAVMEKILWETFLLRLFFGKPKTFPAIVGTLSTFPVKKTRLGINKPVTSSG